MKTNRHIRRVLITLSSTFIGLALAQGVYGQAAPETADKAAPQAPRPPGQDKASYFIASQVDWVPLLPPPPAPGSPEQQRDLQAVLDAQAANRKGERRETAIKDVEHSCARIATVLGTDLDEKKLPKSSAFLKKAAAEADSAAGVVKSYWKRPRPYVGSSKVARLGDMDPEYMKKKQQEQKEKEQKEKEQTAANSNPGGMAASGMSAGGPPEDGARRPPPSAGPNRDNAKPADPEEEKKKLAEQQKTVDNSSYPSGHATFGTLCAIFLTQMVPEKQAELFARAEEYRQSRLIVGAHFRTDIESGRAIATAAAAIISQNAAFQRDLIAARTELRAALNLPAELPAPPNADKEKNEADKKEDPKKD